MSRLLVHLSIASLATRLQQIKFSLPPLTSAASSSMRPEATTAVEATVCPPAWMASGASSERRNCKL